MIDLREEAEGGRSVMRARTSSNEADWIADPLPGYLQSEVQTGRAKSFKMQPKMVKSKAQSSHSGNSIMVSARV